MADIKLYGKIHNQDGNLLISPLEVAGVNNDGSIPEGAATSENNIVSYINEKIKGVNTNVGNIKTGIKSVSVDGTLEPNTTVSITVTGNDGSKGQGNIQLGTDFIHTIDVIPNIEKPKFGTSSPISTLSIKNYKDVEVKQVPVTIELPNNDDVGNAWEKSTTATNYKSSVTSAIGTAKQEAQNYTDKQIGLKLGKVYKPQGNATIANICTIIPKDSVGNVWNMTEEFRIDGKVYPKYTNIVIVDATKFPSSVNYDRDTTVKPGGPITPGQGFSGEVVDALGGMIDQTAIQDNITEKFNKSIVGIKSANTYPTFNPVASSNCEQELSYTLGDGTNGKFKVKFINTGISNASTSTYGLVQIGEHINVSSGTISVPIATSGVCGVVTTSTLSPISINGNGELNIKLANNSGITKSATGELSITKNTFTAGTGISITKTANDFSIGFNTTYISNSETSTGIPLYYNTKLNGFYITGNEYLNVTTNAPDHATQLLINIEKLKSGLGLSSKADVSTVKDLTSRVEALESLLSLG